MSRETRDLTVGAVLFVIGFGAWLTIVGWIVTISPTH